MALFVRALDVPSVSSKTLILKESKGRVKRSLGCEHFA
jgi:hypothetical protein